MHSMKRIKTALISVYNKDGIDAIVHLLDKQGVTIYSTGGTFDYIKSLGIEAKTIESLTGYPSILGGRVKTLHPKVFGGILFRRESPKDIKQVVDFQLPQIDLVIVDLYPFEETVKQTSNEAEIIEKIDIGGISLIRAAAKNFNDVLCVASSYLYPNLLEVLTAQKAQSTLVDRKYFAAHAFAVSSHYDTSIFNYFNKNQDIPALKISENQSNALRYGENPHQNAAFYGNLEEVFEKLNGKEISYNNTLDIDAAIHLIQDFSEPTVAIIKHNNACGIASCKSLSTAWDKALFSDPLSAFGGIICVNRKIDEETAQKMNSLFFEILIAPDFDEKALEIVCSKKNRIVLKLKDIKLPKTNIRSALNGFLCQEKDVVKYEEYDIQMVTTQKPDRRELEDLIFADKVVKHTKSNAIVLVKNNMMIASGMGQTSRVDALKQAIEKAKSFGFDLKGAVMASDAFFPFPDCIEIANEVGITAVIQPGGSLKDQDSTDACNRFNMSMIHTGKRHFKH
ncbi:MAG: bifunctional phosphoribosylaminoimidazolecarboxamide formyltransferase/IMP cyclohydrolase [Bacteroidales bacterium]|nr:bifunctional phosphoribosylaminoimidazolecarboxamide formyltransferase/IMP cyclohydrolase [Bacteroidales bacterium]